MSLETEFEEWFNQSRVVNRHMTDEVLRVKLGEINLPEACWVGADDSIQIALEVMLQKRVAAVLVCSPQSRDLVGIFTERDLLTRCIELGNLRQRELKTVMTSNPVCLNAGDSVGFALNKMMTLGFRHIPILQEQSIDRPYAMASVRALLTYLVEHFPEDVINLPPDPQVLTSRHGG